MSRPVILCRRPYRLRAEQAEAWRNEELQEVLRRDRDSHPALAPGGACGELLADMRLLGMSPVAALAVERNTIELRRS